MSTELGGVYNTTRPMRTSQTFLAIDVNRFLPRESFVERMEWLVSTVKSAAPAIGFDEVLVAGDPEWRAEEERRRNGIPLSSGAWKALVEIAGTLGVPIPAPSS